MFAKLLKHEWKSSWNTLGILSISCLGLGVLGAALLRYLTFCLVQLEAGNEQLITVMTMLVLVLVCLGIALGVYNAAVHILLLYRFYRHKFSDEGYLTFTLPVSSRQLFLSSYVNILLWSVISCAVTVTAVFVAALFGTAAKGLINAELLVGIGNAIQEIAFRFLDTYDGMLLPVVLLQLLTSLLSAPVISMTCITVGAIIAKKHKILAAFGMYYVISSILGFAGTFFTIVFSVALQDVQQLTLSMGYLVQILLRLGTAAGGYFLSTYLMKHKLNLP